MGIWVIVCVQKPPHHILQTFRPLRMFKIVFRDSSLYPGFFKGVLGTQFGSLELKIGFLESEKIIIGPLESKKIGSLESEKSGP